MPAFNIQDFRLNIHSVWKSIDPGKEISESIADYALLITSVRQ